MEYFSLIFLRNNLTIYKIKIFPSQLDSLMILNIKDVIENLIVLDFFLSYTVKKYLKKILS